MAITVKVTWNNAGPHTVWGKLAERLGREPTNAEAAAEVKRIFDEAAIERAGKGQLWFQK
jgi:hypothetical protein